MKIHNHGTSFRLASGEKFSLSPLDPFMAGGDRKLSRRIASEIARSVAPHQFWRRKVKKILSVQGERELRLLPVLCRPGAAAFDIGAAGGIYSVHIAQLQVSKCIAFEPRTWQAEYLRQLARGADLPMTVEEVAVSDSNGRTVLRIPLRDQGLSTIEAGNRLEDADQGDTILLDVTTRTIDSYESAGPVGFIKIDVEGAEGAVLRGATSVLENCRPRLLIEVENRHRAGATEDVFATMVARGYRGFFLEGRTLVSVSEFNAGVHQDPRNLFRSGYVNNFLFLPDEETPELVDAVAALPAD